MSIAKVFLVLSIVVVVCNTWRHSSHEGYRPLFISSLNNSVSIGTKGISDNINKLPPLKDFKCKGKKKLCKKVDAASGK